MNNDQPVEKTFDGYTVGQPHIPTDFFIIIFIKRLLFFRRLFLAFRFSHNAKNNPATPQKRF